MIATIDVWQKQLPKRKGNSPKISSKTTENTFGITAKKVDCLPWLAGASGPGSL